MSPDRRGPRRPSWVRAGLALLALALPGALAGADTVPPTLLFLTPGRGAIVGGVERVKVQVFDLGGLAATDPVNWSLDAGPPSPAVSPNANYACGSGCAVFEFDWDTTAAANGAHTLTVRATDASGNAALATLAVLVNNQGATPGGSGLLLRRSHGSQLCLDCHNLKTHSSQETGSKYGNWAVDCLACHTAHRTTNIHLVKNALETPSSGTKDVLFSTEDKAGGTNPQGSYLGTYDPSGAPYDDGICEVCHTRTTHYRNDGSGGDHSHQQAQRCIKCHRHESGFKGSGCSGCHKSPPDTPALGPVHAAHDGSGAAAYGQVANGSTAGAYGFPCGKCHPQSESQHMNGPGDGSAGNPFVVQVEGFFDSSAEPQVQIPSGATPAFVPGAATSEQGPGGNLFRYGPGTCQNIYCHGEFPGGKTGNDPVFQQGTQPCGSCHGASASDPPSGGRHATHLNAGHGGTSTAYACSLCHRGTTDAAGAVIDRSRHVNGAADWELDRASALVGPGATYSGAASGAKDPPGAPYGTCDTVYCHSNGNPVTGSSAPLATYQPMPWSATCTPCHWRGSETGCDGCHGADALAREVIGSSALRKGSLAHVKHVVAYGYPCKDCHAETMLNRASNKLLDESKAVHVNGAKEVRFFTYPLDQTAGTYAGAPSYTCLNTYCHSDGQNRTPPFTSGPSVAWNATGTCRSCHAGDASSLPVMASGKHAAHVDNAAVIGTNILCSECHSATVSGNTTIVSASRHVNGAAEVGLPSGTYSAPTCTNTYCHSSGQATTAPIQYYPQAWNSGSLACDGCHGRHSDHAFTPVAGEPNYANGGPGSATANSHQIHVSSASDCASCHYDTTSTGTAILPGSARHTDGLRDVAIAPAHDANGGTQYDNYDPATKTCTSIRCHGSGAPRWGGAAGSCRDCHLASGAGKQDAEDFTFGNGVTAAVDAEDWRAYGHGRWAADGPYAESGNPPADLDAGGSADGCLYCHTGSVAHGQANLFRLANTGAGATAADKNGVCLACHGGPGYDPDGAGPMALKGATKAIDSYHYGYAHGGPGKGGLFCWDCHDPHGDYNYSAGQRLGYMVQELPTRDHGGEAGWGIPEVLAPAPDFRSDRDGTAGWTCNDYITSVTSEGYYRGICQVCHTRTSVFRQDSLLDSTYCDPPHNFRCSSCHPHNQPPNMGLDGSWDVCWTCHAFAVDPRGGIFHKRPPKG